MLARDSHTNTSEDHQEDWLAHLLSHFSTLPKVNGEDVKVAQELLPHASRKITLDAYAQAVTPDKRRAQTKVAEKDGR